MAQPVKVVKARLKFKENLPMTLEYALLNQFGFEYFSRRRNEWVIYEKYTGSSKPKVIKYDDLSESTLNELTRRVNRIAGCFANPDEHKDLIKIRCTNMARTLGPKERQWVLDWIKRVIDEDTTSANDPDNDIPWTDGKVIDPTLLKEELQEKL